MNSDASCQLQGVILVRFVEHGKRERRDELSKSETVEDKNSDGRVNENAGG